MLNIILESNQHSPQEDTGKKRAELITEYSILVGSAPHPFKQTYQNNAHLVVRSEKFSIAVLGAQLFSDRSAWLLMMLSIRY